jgi:hypothetical protein
MAGVESVIIDAHEEPVVHERFLKGLFFDARSTLETFGLVVQVLFCKRSELVWKGSERFMLR